ncbi:MAG: hypothetical protein QOI09_1914 [Chloroflexota bacterium]|nr:hypothetical protein [Chloroflexota bacterium]
MTKGRVSRIDGIHRDQGEVVEVTFLAMPPIAFWSVRPTIDAQLRDDTRGSARGRNGTRSGRRRGAIASARPLAQ